MKILTVSCLPPQVADKGLCQYLSSENHMLPEYRYLSSFEDQKKLLVLTDQNPWGNVQGLCNKPGTWVHDGTLTVFDKTRKEERHTIITIITMQADDTKRRAPVLDGKERVNSFIHTRIFASIWHYYAAHICSVYAFKTPIRQLVHPNPFLMMKKGTLADHGVLVILLLKYLIILGQDLLIFEAKILILSSSIYRCRSLIIWNLYKLPLIF